jgi:hypothetical protein
LSGMPETAAALQNLSHRGRRLRRFRGGGLTLSCRRKADIRLFAHLGHPTPLDKSPKADIYHSAVGRNQFWEAANHRTLPSSIAILDFDD